MILINQIKLKPGFTEEDLIKKGASLLHVLPKDIRSARPERVSIDARDKSHIRMTVNAVFDVIGEAFVLRRSQKNPDISEYKETGYSFPDKGSERLAHRPVIAGAGPAGLFAALKLAENGYRPIVLERGLDVDSRTRVVNSFFETGKLEKNTNVLFGEGGAGTFSDGKLNTLVKDPSGRNKEVLETFIRFGADPSIAYDSKPHIGTDVLTVIIKNIREHIKELGGEFRFNAEVTDVLIKDGVIKGVFVNSLNDPVECDVLLLATGHSARDTIKMLYDKGMTMEQKDFAVGFRVMHEQALINRLFLTEDPEILKHTGPAAYKLTYKHASGRGVYSFCMCPGGYVVNSSSEEGRLSINGMSYSGRDGKYANSAMIISVGSKDYGSDHPLAGIDFQRNIEEKAFSLGHGFIPVEYYGDFKNDILGTDDQEPLDRFFDNDFETKGNHVFSKVSDILPDELNRAFIDAMDFFDKVHEGFGGKRVLVLGIESRTSSPVRIVRNEGFESPDVKGLYPLGEGAGYAGGIMSAAMDGIKGAEAVAKIYAPFKE